MKGIPSIVRLLRERQLRILEQHRLPPPAFTVWDPEVPESRVRDSKKRGLIQSRDHGMLSRIYCTDCGRPSPYAATETLLKTFYKCTACVGASGAPAGAAMVPGTAGL